MQEVYSDPILGFVWRSKEIGRSVVDAAQQTDTFGIFELENLKTETAEVIFKAGATDALIPAVLLMGADVASFLARSGLETLWVEYHPAMVDQGLDAFFGRISELNDKVRIIPVTGDWEFLSRLLELDSIPIETVALKGSEASGLVSPESVGVLFSTWLEHLEKVNKTIKTVIWGGVGTAEAAAAFLTCGGAGVVFESLHWQTDLIQAGEESLKRLARFRPEQSALVGSELGVSFRFYDKGNSKAQKELADLALSLMGPAPSTKEQTVFIGRVSELSIHALESEFGRDQVIPLGPEASFSGLFVEQYGQSTITALSAFRAEIIRIFDQRDQALKKFSRSGTARALGTTYPFIQGAMSWISDVPAFALEVSKAGGLPTVALGIRPRKELEGALKKLKQVMGDRSYALNVLTLSENPFMEEQLALLEDIKPPFVVIAAGEPSHACRLMDKDIKVIYIAPDEGLLRLALDKGVRWVILEGCESGGHIGTQTTLTLAQTALSLKKRQPDLFEGVNLILAGGIFNRRTAVWAGMLGADALQMGTVYLASKEIVSTGALSSLYQRLILESGPLSTGITGQSVGLRVRALKTPKFKAILDLEKRFVAGQEEESAFRRRLELLSAGSLLVAARGVKSPGGKALKEEDCLKEGQFMSGATAGAISRVTTLSELHREMAEGALPATAVRFPSKRKMAKAAPAAGPRKERVAITGWALVNSLGNDPHEVWANLMARKSGIVEVPPSKWDHSDFYDPDPGVPERTYCKWGAFQNLKITRKELGIPPQDFRTMAESTKLTMYLAHNAIMESGILDSDVARDRIGVIVSQNSGESASTISDLVVGVSVKKIIRSIRNVLELTPELELAVTEQIKAGRIRVDDTTLLGRLNCAAGGFICNKYGFMGPSYSVTAACATSQVAMYTAIQMIRNGIIDVAVVGGGEELLTPAHFVEFSALGALAGITGVDRLPHQSSRPFDSGRDGMVLGEGGAMIIIERESLARKRGARIHAYIRGVGASNSDQGMVESNSKPQQLAIAASFRDAETDPTEVDLVECHATGTVQGDVEEVQALKGFFPHGRKTYLASFKSQIGHTLGASGLNSLVRGIMAMKHGVIPSTLNYDSPDPDISLEEWGFVVPDQPEQWPRMNGNPRRLMANSFGFGGANYVVQIEECMDDMDTVLVAAGGVKPGPETDSGSKGNTADNEPAALEGVSFYNTTLTGRTFRVGVVADDETDAAAKVAAIEPISVPPSEKWLRALGRRGVFVGPVDETPPPLSMVFAGQGTVYPGMGQKLYQTFPIIRKWMDKIASLAEFDLLQIMFKSDSGDLKNTLWQQPALYCLEYAILRQLLALGVTPVAMAGHSMGELTALAVADVVNWEDGFRIINKRAQCMDKAAGLSVDPGVMIAVDAPADVLEKLVAENDEVYFTNYNSPRQVVLGGNTEPTLALMEKLKGDGYWTVQLKVSMAFHSPVMRTIRDEMAEFVSHIDFQPPRIPVLSNTTMQPYPDEAGAIRKIIMAHLEQPVHWRQNVTALWENFGVRDFLEIGPKATLSNMINDTYEQARCINICHPEDEVQTLRTGAARLFSLGHLTRVKPAKPAPTPSKTVRTTPAAGRAVPSPAAGSPENRVASIIQREINAFVLESFGRFLKPALLDSIRREADPSFTEEKLDALLTHGLGAPAAARPMALMAEKPAIKQAPAAQAPQPAQPVARVAATPPKAGPVQGDYTERVIRIIMDATGYERDEIEPEMDIRSDLAIRSSRLPVIMDAAEKEFGITVKLEDFMGVRTVQAMADRIKEVVERDGGGVITPAESTAGPIPGGETKTETSAETGKENVLSIKRLVMTESPWPQGGPTRIVSIPAGSRTAVIGFGQSPLTTKIADYVKNRLQAEPVLIEAGQEWDSEKDGANKAIELLKDAGPLAGLILVLDPKAEEATAKLDRITGFMTGFFSCLKTLLASKDRKFCLLVTENLSETGPAYPLAEGILGMFLAAAHEYGSVLFRSLYLTGKTDIEASLAQALDQENKIIQMIVRGDKAYTLKGINSPVKATKAQGLDIGPESVIVISGGGRGVTAELARTLAFFKPRLALLGRTEAELAPEYQAFVDDASIDSEKLTQAVKKNKPELTGEELEKEIQQARNRIELAGKLKALRDLGLTVDYHRLDVADRKKCQGVIKALVKKYGRVDGLIHGAGLLRDSFLDSMTADDFARVFEVKYSGAVNLYRAARDHGLKFMVVLSSQASIQGNPGQVNYCAANRAMAALMPAVAADKNVVLTKALMLPPIDGAGMADNPELKELFKLRGMDGSWVHVDELAELFVREMFLGDRRDFGVLFARMLPKVPAVLIETDEIVSGPQAIVSDGMTFEGYEYPMVQKVTRLDLGQGLLEASRNFSLKYDIWVEDHKPFKFIKNPPVAGIMAIETFLETARLLYPYLHPVGVREVEYKGLLEVPFGQEIEARLACKKKTVENNETLCAIDLESRDISARGRPLDRWTTNYSGQVILAGSVPVLGHLPDFPINPKELTGRSIEHAEVVKYYGEHSSMTGRFRVLHSLDGVGPGVVSGLTVYEQGVDFPDFDEVVYQYPPYLFEAMMHLFPFYQNIRDITDTRTMIPYKVGELRFSRVCQPGERLKIQARLRSDNDEARTWDAQATDQAGQVVIRAQGIVMRWFAE